MGCAQSVPATQQQPDSLKQEVSGRQSSPDTGSTTGVSLNGKQAANTTKQVRDSVQDITSQDGKASKHGGRHDVKEASGEAINGNGPSSVRSTLLPGQTRFSGATSDADGRAGHAGNGADEVRPQSLDVGEDQRKPQSPAHPRALQLQNSSHRHSAESLAAAAGYYADGSAVGTSGGSATGMRPGSVDKHSNRSSFANEGVARAGGNGGGVGGGGDGRRSSGSTPPPLPAVLAAARSSAQARLSSIQAADLMGVGGDKVAALARAQPAAYDPLPGYQPPPAAAQHYPPLGALPPDTPVPLFVLQRLWRLGSEQETLAVCAPLAEAGVLRLAALEDGSRWALPAPPHLAHAAAAHPQQVDAAHVALLGGYTEGGKLPLDGLRDDGYIIQSLSHHLVGARRLDGLRRLLMNPGWLEAKLHAYGVGAVVRDFRRYLQEAGQGDEAGDVKLLLQAFQLSLGAAMEHPTCRMMREQMLARVMAVSAGQGGRLKEWYDEQAAKCAAEGMLAISCRLLHLMPRTPSLTQAGGLHRMTLRGHHGPIRRVAIAPNCVDVVTISEDGSAQVWDMNIGDCVMQLARDAPLTAVGLTPDSGAAVVAAEDGRAAVWDLAAGRVAHTLTGHTAKINALAIDRQGLRCLTASDDRTCRVWNLQSGACEGLLAGHGGTAGMAGAVLDVAISADGSLAVTACDDFLARAWDLDAEADDDDAGPGPGGPAGGGCGELVATLEGHGGWVTSVAFIGTTERVVTASHDATARIWDAPKGRCLFVLSGHEGRLNRVVLDPGGALALTCSDDNAARVWDVETGECLQVLEGHSAYVTDAAITRDRHKAVTVSGDGSGAIWDLSTGQREASLEGHAGEVRAVVLTQRGRFAVTAGADCTARVWDLAARPLAPPPTHSGRVSALQALPDGALVVSAGEDGRVFLWDPAEGYCLKRMEGHRSGVRFMRVAADGSQVLTGSGDRQICRWNWADYSAAAAAAGKRRSMERRDMLMHTLAAARGSGGSAASQSGFHALGSPALPPAGPPAAASAGAGTGVASPPLPTSPSRTSGEEDPLAVLAALGSPGAAPVAAGASPPKPAGGAAEGGSAAAPESPAASAAAQARAGLAQGDTSSKSLLDLVAAVQADPLRASMPAQLGSRVKHMAFDAACRTAAVLLFDSTVSLWDVDSGRCTGQLIKRGERDASRTHSGGVNAVYLTRDAGTAVTISKDNTARVWDVATASTRFVVEGHTDGLVAADISGDEALLATAAYDRTVRVTRLAGGATLAVLDHPQPPVSVAFSPNSAYMAVALEDFTVVVWDLVGRRCLPCLDAHKAELSCLAWSPDSRFLLTAGADCTLRLWRAEDGRPHAFFMADAPITAACFAGTPAADIIAAGDAAGAVHFLDFGEELQG